jgi:hypothetical protein
MIPPILKKRDTALKWMILLWLLTGIATFDLLLGIFIFIAGSFLSAVLLALIPWILRLFKVPESLRLKITSAFLICLALLVFIFSNKHFQNQDAIRLALAGHIPSGIHDFYLHEDSFQDEAIWAYFKCEPESLRQILNKVPFKSQKHDKNDPAFRNGLDFRSSRLDDIHTLPVVNPYLSFERTDLPKLGSRDGWGQCIVYTDPAYSFAYIEYTWQQPSGITNTRP